MWIVAGALAILAVVFGLRGIGLANCGEASNRGMAIAGLITGLAAAGMTVAGLAIFHSGLGRLDHDLHNVNSSSGSAQMSAQHTVSRQEQRMIAQDVFIGNE